ncbi:iron(III) transport system permease protein [Rhodoferax ferrireducens]|uniref:Iron(III) transport system permease protein n=1 Tax=Rhodoferax ferrireducens TaxID=192843 RepID=A0ABU2CG27_9BURK|nr:iron ABC transporter permease [Rhodoferax ferrireducens]MDR7380306.1 iron(III) transport system permease protein [Rhodoferax ferrireducens]
MSVVPSALPRASASLGAPLHGLRRRGPRGFSWVGSAAVLVSLFALLPLGFVVWVAWQTGWDVAAPLVFRPRVGELLVNTALLVVITVPLCAVLALALAWLTERSDLPGARTWSWLAVAPLAVPAFVHSYAWMTVAPSLHGLLGGVLVSVIAYFPFMYLPLSAALRRLDPGMEDAAASLGLGPWGVFFRVVLPQLRLALCGGALLVGLHLLAEYGLFVMIRFDTFTTAIVDQFQSTYNGPAANMLAGVLVVCCFVLLGLESGVRGSERYARVGTGAARMPLRSRLGRYTVLAWLLPFATTVLALGVPFFTLGRWLIAGGSAVWQLDAMGAALGQTLLLALVGGLLTTLVSVPMAWLSIRAPGKLQRVLEACNYMVGSLPGVVVALALVTITVRVALPLYQTAATILLAYMLMFLPRALVSLRAGIAQAPIELEYAARSLGRSPAQALWSVTMRLAAPGAAAGMALVSLGITNELTATLLLAPTGTQTLATAFWAFSSEIDYAAAAPYALTMVLLSMPLTWLLYVQSKRTAGR